MLVIFSANRRATASMPPPGGKLTIRRMLRDGYLSCAAAGAASPRTPASSSASVLMVMLILCPRILYGFSHRPRRVPVRRLRQTEIFPKRRSLVFGAEQPAALQLRHHHVD